MTLHRPRIPFSSYRKVVWWCTVPINRKVAIPFLPQHRWSMLPLPRRLKTVPHWAEADGIRLFENNEWCSNAGRPLDDITRALRVYKIFDIAYCFSCFSTHWHDFLTYSHVQSWCLFPRLFSGTTALCVLFWILKNKDLLSRIECSDQAFFSFVQAQRQWSVTVVWLFATSI